MLFRSRASKAKKPNRRGAVEPGVAARMEEESSVFGSENERRQNVTPKATIPVVTAPVTQAAPKDEDDSTYTVKEGDTLWSLGGKTNKGLSRLQQLNPNINADNIKVGQKIKIR